MPDPYYYHDSIMLFPDCECPRLGRPRRYLQDNTTGIDDTNTGETWEIAFTCVVLAAMFAALVSDRIGADSVMMAALTAFMAAEIITVSEGLVGFSNQGLLTVLVLFVVAEGISKTGALDWYMGKLLGRPKTIAAAQLKLMIPIAIVSAFLNNTPVVAVMIPIVQRWAKNINVSPQQLLIPLSFASILGGTCTLIGTSTNLVVVGLLNDRYPNDPELDIGLFDLGQFGVPVAMAGIAYVLLLSPFLLPGADSASSSTANKNNLLDAAGDILLGARLTQWSPAAGRSVQRSGLRDTGGIYLVSVHRAATGNVHRAVSNDFVLNVGDTLYFTGLVEGFGDFCEEQGLELVTNEVEEAVTTTTNADADDSNTLASPAATTTALVRDDNDSLNNGSGHQSGGDDNDFILPKLVTSDKSLPTLTEDEELLGDIPIEVGVTKESLLLADYDVRLQNIHRMTDIIRGVEPSGDSIMAVAKSKRQSQPLRGHDSAKIVVTIDGELVVVGINAHDRSGLLLDISKGLLRLRLQLRHTEAAVRQEHSLSIWRCECAGTDIPDLEEIWSVLSAMLSNEDGIEAIKKRGLKVVRARVVKGSRLVGKTAVAGEFRERYKAAIVAVRKDQKNISTQLQTVSFDVDDVLVLQASNDSPLLFRPPHDFYKKLSKANETPSRSSSVQNLVKLITRSGSGALDTLDQSFNDKEIDFANVIASKSHESDDDFFLPSRNELDDVASAVDEEAVLAVDAADNADALEAQEAIWKDLAVLFREEGEGAEAAAREFLTAMTVAPNSNLAGKTVAKIGINKLPDLFLVSIDRPNKEEKRSRSKLVLSPDSEVRSVGGNSEVEGSVRTENQTFTTISLEEPLQEGDILWFSGSASAVGDLRKIPGLVSYQNDEVKKIIDKVHDRRLVQAVIARKGPLVGKTVKETHFRTRYGAAVIAVHREGKRVHEHPGKIKLQAGDVLLLEAGPSFLGKGAENDRSFALLAEVENSAPPRLRLLIPALVITAGMLIAFTADLTSLLVAGLVASILMVALGILSESEARNAVNWEIYLTIAAAFGIGQALINSGVADAIASFLVDIGTAVGLGDAGLLGAVYFATFLISNVVTNNAAAALLFPIAMDAAEQTGTDRTTMAFTLMLGASASFMSPFGYTTNLMIYGPGGYKYKDFLYFGTPMQLVLWVLSISYLSVFKPWYLSWIGTCIILVLVSVALIGNSSMRERMKARRAALRDKESGEAGGGTDDSS
jgi:di/tricarboxylate transporter